MAAGWSAEETRELITMWGQENVQSQLDTVARNRVIFKNIVKELGKIGYARTWQQCRTKIKNLTQRYRKVNRPVISNATGLSYTYLTITTGERYESS